MNFKKLLGLIHLWIGLILGLLFFVIAFSGAIYTWAQEISAIIYHQKVEPKQQSLVSVSTLKATIDREFPDGDFRTAFYRDNASTIEVLLYGQGTYYHAQINPYTGDFVHLQDMNKGWLNYVKFIHRNLMLGKIGQQIVHWGTLLFLIMIITSMVLWWPVNKAVRNQRFTIKWGASTKKLNYDIHNVLGFYAIFILMFTALTGIFWGFGVVKNTFKEATGENEIVYDTPKSNKQEFHESFNQFAILDSLALEFRKRYPSKFIRISNPHEATDPIIVNVIEPELVAFNADHFYFDRYTGKQINGHFQHGLHSDASLFTTISALIYDIHLGVILAFPGKLLVFLASLIAASLPVTGFIVWLGKRKKSGF